MTTMKIRIVMHYDVISTELTATTLFANVPYNVGMKNLIP